MTIRTRLVFQDSPVERMFVAAMTVCVHSGVLGAFGAFFVFLAAGALVTGAAFTVVVTTTGAGCSRSVSFLEGLGEAVFFEALGLGDGEGVTGSGAAITVWPVSCLSSSLSARSGGTVMRTVTAVAVVTAVQPVAAHTREPGVRPRGARAGRRRKVSAKPFPDPGSPGGGMDFDGCGCGCGDWCGLGSGMATGSGGWVTAGAVLSAAFPGRGGAGGG